MIFAKDYGFMGDGTASDHQKLKDAVNAANSTGDQLYFDPKPYIINSDNGTVDLRELHVNAPNVTDVSNGASAGNPESGAIFYVRGNNYSPFSIQRGATIQNIGIFYPDQDASDFLVTPPSYYPPTFSIDPANDGLISSAGFIRFLGMKIYNAYSAFKLNLSNGDAGNIHFEGSDIFCLSHVFELDETRDILKIFNNTFSPGIWKMASANKAKDYAARYATVAKIKGGIDGFYWHDNLVTGYHCGWDLDGTNGNSAYCSISGNSFECEYGIKIRSGASLNIADISNTKFISNPSINGNTTKCIDINQNDTTAVGPSRINISGCHFRSSNKQHVNVTGDGEVLLNIANTQMFNPYREASSYSDDNAAIHIDNPKSVFNMSNTQINVNNRLNASGVVVDNARCVNITGNYIEHAYDGIRVLNTTKPSVVNNNTFNDIVNIKENI